MKTQSKGNYAFIDNQNLNLGTQKVGWKMNWRRFREYLRDEYGVDKAFMFIGYMPENIELYELMHSLGFLVVLKPTLEMYKNPAGEGVEKTPEEKKAVKGNIDVELTLYAVKEMPNYDKAVIVSGDGDFFALIEHLEQKGKLLNVMVPNYQYSTLFKPFEKYVVRIDQLKHELKYPEKSGSKKQSSRFKK